MPVLLTKHMASCKHVAGHFSRVCVPSCILHAAWVFRKCYFEPQLCSQLPGETEFYTASVNSNDIWIPLTAFELLKMRVLLDPEISGWKISDRYSVLQTYGSLQGLQPSLRFKMCWYIHFRYRKPIEKNCKSDIAILHQWLDSVGSCGDILQMITPIVTPNVQRRKCILRST